MFEFVPSDELVRDLARHRAWMFSRQRLDATPTYAPHLFEPVSEARIRESVKIRFGRLLGSIASRVQDGRLGEVVLVEAGKFVHGFERALRADLRIKSGRAGDTLMFRIAREFYHEVRTKGGDIPLNAQAGGPRVTLIEGGNVTLHISRR